MSNVSGLPPKVVELEDGEHYMFQVCEFCGREIGVAWLSTAAWEAFAAYADRHLQNAHPEHTEANDVLPTA